MIIKSINSKLIIRINFPNTFFLASSENKMAPKKVIMAILDGKYGISKIPTIETGKIKKQVNTKMNENKVANTT